MLILSNKDFTIKPYLYGEDFYMQTLVELMRKKGNHVDIAIVLEDGIRVYKHERITLVKSIASIAKDYDVIMLHNISPSRVWLIKLKYNLNLIMPVYFLWNKMSPIINNIRGRIGLTLWQFFIDKYVVPDYSIARGLRLQGIFKKIYVIPPLYKCPFCNFEENAKKRSMSKKGLPRNVKVVYIGSLNLKRLPFVEVVKRFTKDQSRIYEITIYTADNIDEKVYEFKNVRVRIIKKILSAEEKCRVLRESHMFIAPRRGTTMIPSISVMEADYHGNIVIRDGANA